MWSLCHLGLLEAGRVKFHIKEMCAMASTDRPTLACMHMHTHSLTNVDTYADQLISSEAGLRRAEREILISVKAVFKQARMGEA